MITIEGKSVFGGVSIGKLMFYKRNEKVIRRTHVDDVDAEWKRFEEAKNTAIDQLKVLYDKAIEDVGEANAMIFEIHQMMLDDLDYLESIEGIIRTQSVNAEYAVSTTADNFAQMFASMDDAYMQGRAADVKDVSERVLDILCGVSNGTREMTEPCIVAADDLAPSETVQLDKEKVLGFATMYGSSNSHTAILARTMNIPAVIGMGEALNPKYDGEMAIIDGFTGTLYVDPDEETLAKMQEKRAKDLEQKELLNQLKGKENVTKSGQKINVYANIGNVSDLGAVLKNDAGGVGLFRSEFLYLEREALHRLHKLVLNVFFMIILKHKLQEYRCDYRCCNHHDDDRCENLIAHKSKLLSFSRYYKCDLASGYHSHCYLQAFLICILTNLCA